MLLNCLFIQELLDKVVCLSLILCIKLLLFRSKYGNIIKIHTYMKTFI